MGLELRITKNSEKFRGPAIHFEKYETYTFAPPGTSEYIKYWTDEMNYCLHGYKAFDGDSIPGYFYFYLNYFQIKRLGEVEVDVKGKKEIRTQYVQGFPRFYDYDRYFFEVVEACEDLGKHLIVLKARRKGYSYKVASMLCRNYYLIRGSKNYALASEAEFLIKDGILTKAWDGMDFIDMNTAWYKKRQRVDTKMHKRASFIMKDESGVPIEMGYKSEIMGVTLKNDAQKARGKSGKLIIFEEAGKFPNLLEAWQIARPSVEQGSKVMGTMIAFGTGGTVDADYEGLRELFENPTAYNCLVLKNIWDEHLYNTDCGFFVPQYANLEGVHPRTKDLFMDENGNTCIGIAKGYILDEREKIVKNAADRRAIDRHIAEQPITPAEATLNISTNIFPKADIKRHLSFVRNNESIKGLKQVGELAFDDKGRVKWYLNPVLKSIIKFPLKPEDDKKGAVAVWEHPMEDAPYGLYIIGCLLPGEQVLTNKGLMNVEDVDSERLIDKDGDLVETKALLRYEVEDEDTYELKMSNVYRTTTFTKEHPIYVSDHTLNKQHLIKEELFKFDFKKVGDIKKGDWIKYPNVYLNTVETEEDYINYIPLEYWWLAGLWLGDGWCSKNRIYIAFDKSNKVQLDRFKLFARKYSKSEVSVRVRGNTVEASFLNETLATKLTETFGQYAGSKFIPEYIKYEENNIKKQLLLGYLDSDGCVYKDPRGYVSLEFVSINLKLLESFQDIAFSLGLVGNLSKLRDDGEYNIDGRVGNQKKTFHLRFGHNDSIAFAKMCDFDERTKLDKIDRHNLKYTRNRTKQGCFISKDNKYIYIQIKDIIKGKYTGTVYNFETETQTFLCQYCTTHNCDPYDHDVSTTDSLGSAIVYKRFQSFESYYDLPVAEYTGRPDTADEFYEQVRLLAFYYNAKVLYENEKKGLFSYFSHKHCEYLLADQPDIIRDVISDSKVQRSKGIHMNKQIKQWGEGLVKDWLNEEYAPGRKNLTKIYSEPLLEELLMYNPDRGNYDRVMAFMMVMVYIQELYHVNVKKKKSQAKKNVLFKDGIFRNDDRLII